MARLVPKLVGFALVLLAAGSANSEECGEKAGACGPHTGWNEFETIRLRVKQDGDASTSNWFLQTSPQNHDLQLDVDVSDPKSPQHGTILMVEGRTMLSKGIVFVPGYEIDALDAPLLSTVLTMNVLSRALPDGPERLSKPLTVMHEDKETGIQFATLSAEAFIPPGWSVSGTVTPGHDGAVDFDLVLKWTRADGSGTNHPTSTALTGRLKHKTDFKIDSSMSLDGWKVFEVGPIVKKMEGGTLLDYGAEPAKSGPKTVADLRELIAAENSPGKPDLSLNLAGFWKGSCSDDFGLRIKPVDTPGMYTVTFCGPGGCGDEANERKTFITGDQLYTVVSPTELQKGREGNRSTYVKCSDKMLP